MKENSRAEVVQTLTAVDAELTSLKRRKSQQTPTHPVAIIAET